MDYKVNQLLLHKQLLLHTQLLLHQQLLRLYRNKHNKYKVLD